MQGALPPNPTILVFPNINQAYTVTVDKATSLVLEGPAGYSPIRGPNFANAECEALLPPHLTRLRPSSTNEESEHPVMAPNAGTLAPATRIRRFKVPILRILNARPSAAAFCSVHVSRREVGVNLSGVDAECGEIGAVTRIRQFKCRTLRVLNTRLPNATSRPAWFSKQQAGVTLFGVNTECGDIGPASRIRQFGDPILRILNRRHSAAVSRSAHVVRHQVGVKLSGVDSECGETGPATRIRHFEGPILRTFNASPRPNTRLIRPAVT